MKHDKIVIVSGGFDPVHGGHIDYLEEAKKLGDELWVILNTDEFLGRKKGYIFMAFEERRRVLKALKCVDKVIESIDFDQTVCRTLRYIKALRSGDHSYFLNDDSCIFAKGGDRTIENIPEVEICKELGIKMVFGVGGGKSQSSSLLVERAMSRKLGAASSS